MADGDYERTDGRRRSLEHLSEAMREARDFEPRTLESLRREIQDGPAKAIVFDFGGVMTACPMRQWEDTLYAYCATLGLSKRTARDGFVKYRNLWDGGEVTFEELYARIFADEGLPQPTAAQMERIWSLDAAAWVAEKRPETLELMRFAKACGRKVAILSNMSPDFHARLFVPNMADYRAVADVEVISGLVRMCKPDRPIFDYTAAQLGLAPKDLFFVDDTADNVRAARAYGWRAAVYPRRFL